jgi:hypothetical protein
LGWRIAPEWLSRIFAATEEHHSARANGQTGESTKHRSASRALTTCSLRRYPNCACQTRDCGRSLAHQPRSPAGLQDMGRET